jgi:hypothetical protein
MSAGRLKTQVCSAGSFQIKEAKNCANPSLSARETRSIDCRQCRLFEDTTCEPADGVHQRRVERSSKSSTSNANWRPRPRRSFGTKALAQVKREVKKAPAVTMPASGEAEAE